MSGMNKFGQEGLPPAIAAEELQKMLGIGQGFCPSNGPISEQSKLMARWPFVFSPPLMGTSKKSTK